MANLAFDFYLISIRLNQVFERCTIFEAEIFVLFFAIRYISSISYNPNPLKTHIRWCTIWFQKMQHNTPFFIFLRLWCFPTTSKRETTTTALIAPNLQPVHFKLLLFTDICQNVFWSRKSALFYPFACFMIFL